MSTAQTTMVMINTTRADLLTGALGAFAGAGSLVCGSAMRSSFRGTWSVKRESALLFVQYTQKRMAFLDVCLYYSTQENKMQVFFQILPRNFFKVDFENLFMRKESCVLQRQKFFQKNICVFLTKPVEAYIIRVIFPCLRKGRQKNERNL